MLQVKQVLLSAVRRNRETAKSKSVYADLLEGPHTERNRDHMENILDIR